MGSSSHRDWAWLPRELLCSIQEKLDLFSDYVRFSSVCQPWRRVALEDNVDGKQKLDILRTCHNKLPMLLVETKEGDVGKRLLISATELGKTYQLQLPLPCDNRFFGSSLGWLLFADKSLAVTLFNPFVNDGIVHLPVFKDPFRHFEFWIGDDSAHDYFIRKGLIVEVSSDHFRNDSDHKDYMVVVLYGRTPIRLAFFRPGCDSWNFIKGEPSFISDIINYKGQIYAINFWNEFVRLNLVSGTDHRVVVKGGSVDNQDAYLVESMEGDLLLVQRFRKVFMLEDDDDFDEHVYKTYPEGSMSYGVEDSTFKVFKLVQYPTHEEREYEATWVQIKSIGDQALFLGDNHSVCISTLDFPSCQSNSIYYTDQRHNTLPLSLCLEHKDEIGVFNLEDGSSHSLRMLDDPSQKLNFPPIWFVPNLKENKMAHLTYLH